MKQRTKRRLESGRFVDVIETKHSCRHCANCIVDHCIVFSLDIPEEYRDLENNRCESFRDSLEEKKK